MVSLKPVIQTLCQLFYLFDLTHLALEGAKLNSQCIKMDRKQIHALFWCGWRVSIGPPSRLSLTKSVRNFA